MIYEDFHIGRDMTIGDREVEEGGDVLNRSWSEIFQVEDAEFVRAKCLTISTALDCSRNYVRGESLRHLHWFPLGLPRYQSGVS